MNKKIFDVDTNTNKNMRYESIFPEWSPDNSMILFSSTSVSADGYVGPYALFVLKNIVY